MVAGDAADIVVQIVDARNIRRALMLTAQLAGLGKPVLVALNMVDEALARASPWMRTSWRASSVCRSSRWSPSRGAASRRCAIAWPTRGLGVAGPGRCRRPGGVGARGHLSRAPRHDPLARDDAGGAVARDTPAPDRPADSRARARRRRLRCADARRLRRVVGGRLVNPAAISLVSLVPVPLVRDFFVGDYGLITMGLTYAIAIVLPVVTTFFLLFGFLEDSGYIPRSRSSATASSVRWA